MANGYLIDPTSRTITEVAFTGLGELQKLVGGYIEIAYMWRPNGDTLFVDEEGMYRHAKHFSLRERPDQTLAGNGVLVGMEVDGPYEGGYTNRDPTMTIKELRERVTWVR